MDDLLAGLIVFLPAGVANASPVLANKIPILNRWQTPLDFGKSYRGKRIFGSNKTWRGVITGTVMGGLAAIVIYQLFPAAYNQLALMSLVPGLEVFFIGLLLGFGALYGDAAESFLKRQHGVPAGQSWFPFDQLDYIIGGLVAVLPFGLFSWSQMGAILVIYFGLHLIVAYLAYLLGLKDRPL